MLVNPDHESRLHAWLLQGMTKTGRLHWKEWVKRINPGAKINKRINPGVNSFVYFCIVILQEQ